ncbi:D-serine ammonia-lyase [Brevibacillus laterosporus]|uniref:D-serine ammonia-lyase n=1 Tax=Brevibacillus laterosporus TaxID=1465 RepID=UPI0018CCEAE1|nr:D-serine ammonia-lyase [Brevibacillus laterosporus]MBG9799227.1 serine ammonia-lyase [Brevibacillus laterosporus]MCR8940398.1 D-serine ammonia-lyase [Brevibacillus laterosporus]MCZ0843037.1 D-serine ammonia-lyase [Brevibacillus laterosporus]MCZ0847362.1 D-serine ammonia-lyase [Brevibacillus laterosporus]MED1909532.1 D-serine ammonia-lyase [Brevibacillus laterosporus]
MSDISTKTKESLKEKYPLINKLISTEEIFWINPNKKDFEVGIKNTVLTKDDVKDAEDRLKRFAPYIAKVFPETKGMNGIIESPLVRIPSMQQHLEQEYEQEILGQLLLKCDSHLPISGSIKARGGVYEVLKHAEDLALEHNLLTVQDDYSILESNKFRNFFSNYSIAVSSTGNLGLSIGIMSAKLGFNVTVHMSADAKQWKKDLLRSKDVTVIEYTADYSKAVEEGRKQAAENPMCYFIDDENSRHLFLGYAVAASRLQKQLDNLQIKVDENHPLFVYLPCGVGGGPGGVAFGLKLLYQDNAHVFFAEPTHSPCMLLGLMTGLHDGISVQDFGIDNVTDADGLAVGRASGFVGKIIEPFLSGSYTVSDNQLYKLLKGLADTEGIYLEPSALAGILGPSQLCKARIQYLQKNNLIQKMSKGTHIVWGTGGSMVPKEVMKLYYQKGVQLTQEKQI